ncbi:MAG: hypothetical protein JSV20_01400, partial [Candidatus Bathyarchaeota archaeon]
IPILEGWLLENGYNTNRIANRVDVTKGVSRVTLFFENFPSGCLIKIFSNDQSFFKRLKKYLADERLLSYQISCSYCGKTYESYLHECPFCGGPT